ncbi:MAG: type IV pilus twitching motility protein PilT [Vulcanimicrobiota bacterium]
MKKPNQNQPEKGRNTGRVVSSRTRIQPKKLSREVTRVLNKADAQLEKTREKNSPELDNTIKVMKEPATDVNSVESAGSLLIATEDLFLSPEEIIDYPEPEKLDFSLEDLLRVMVEHRASDLHLRVGAPPTVRLDGNLVYVGDEPLDEKECKDLILPIMSSTMRGMLAKRREVDFAYAIPGVRFRVNAFLQKQTVGAAFRLLWSEIPTFEELMLPPVMKKLCEYKHGLILVTGPAGSGKSTTLSSMINYINERKQIHIITVEDPIEFIHKDKKCIVTQREIGTDTGSFSTALKQALRQDPDVILIGEMRDAETIMTSVLAAETGHLVLSTLHTPNTYQAINRIVDVFSGDSQNQFRLLLSNTLRGVVSQRLLSRSDLSGRVPAVEVMLNTSTVKSLILEGNTGAIYDHIREGKVEGMQTFTSSLLQLVAEGYISKEEALYHADYPTEIRLALEGHTTGAVHTDEESKDDLISWL